MLRRRRTLPVAEVAHGFVAAEAAAHAPALEAMLGRPSPGKPPVGLDVELEAGLGGRVVVSAANRNVGFVPAAAAAGLWAQLHGLAAAGQRRARLGHQGEAFVHDGEWRVWVGPLPRPQVLEIPSDEVAPQAPAIGGIQLRRGAT